MNMFEDFTDENKEVSRQILIPKNTTPLSFISFFKQLRVLLPNF